MTRRRVLLAVTVLAMGIQFRPASAGEPVVSTHGYRPLVGGMHAHSDYSDGYPGPTPETVFANVKTHNIDFYGLSDHSDTFNVPLVASNDCLVGTGMVNCPGGDAKHPENALRKWDATGEYAAAAATPNFMPLRGFEWTSDRFGHINVFFSKNFINAKADGGYATMEAFYQWFTRSPDLAGGSDGIATFNHPGDKKLHQSDPALDWNGFAYVPAADERMVGIELYNGDKDYLPYYIQALNQGWHVGAVGAEDLGHVRGDDWGQPHIAKTVVLAESNDPASLRAGLLARRFYAVRETGMQLDFTVDDALMGSRITRQAGETLSVHAAINQPGATLEILSTDGAVATATGRTLDAEITVPAGGGWYFLRATDADKKSLGYSSPVWITASGSDGQSGAVASHR